MHVTAVLVAYNRRELVAEALEALASQTRPLDRLIVVDNASDDGSAEVAAEALDSWGDRADLIRMTRNTGGAGGFAVGIATALAEAETDWVWVMDDDTVPDPTALEGALAAHERYRAGGTDNLAVMGSTVLWVDGSPHPMNTPRPKVGLSRLERERAEAQGAVPVRSVSFVSAFLRASRLREIGLPVVDYFLWNDDFELSARMLRGARGLIVPGSVVTHKTRAAGSSTADPGPRFFFEVRNRVWVFRTGRALDRWETPLYLVAVARRWVLTYLGSSDRSQIRDCLRRGLREGFGSLPRPNAEALSDSGAPERTMREVRRLDAVEAAR